MLPQLRPYQTQIVNDVRCAWAAGRRNVLMRLDTGGGKTVTLGNLVESEPGASCVIAHRSELVGQLSVTLARYGVRHDLIASDATKRTIAALHVSELGKCYLTPGARCKVASVDTLVRRTEAVRQWASTVGLWVVDESAHLVIDNKWHKAISLFTRPDVRGLGPTATPVRADGKGLGSPDHGGDGVFDVMVEGPPMRWLIDQGYLAEYRVVCVESDLRLLEEDVSASGDWSPAKLRDASRKSHIVGDIVATYQKWAPGKLTMTFCTDVETAIEVTKAFNDAGIPAATLTGETEDRLRAQMLRQFEKREILQLVSVDVVSEGFDLPALEAVQLARPTQSLGLFRQQVGRALRPKPDGSKALIIDHVGNFLRHGPPDRPVQWSLARRDKRSKGVSDAIPLRVCVECYQPYERIHPACPYCGHEPEPAGRSSPEMVDGDLAELSPEVLERLRAAVAVVDRNVTEVRDHYERMGLPELAVRGQIKQHNDRVRAQADLRDAIAAWGVARCAEGLDQRQRQRLFFHTYGVDVLSARALGRAEAESLTARIT
jgi:superfamily II DNA or RNA helicase